MPVTDEAQAAFAEAHKNGLVIVRGRKKARVLMAVEPKRVTIVAEALVWLEWV